MIYIDPDQAVHPLRHTLEDSDWKRIQQVLDGEIEQHHASLEELDAAQDVLYDAIVAKLQTHYGVTTLQ